MVSARVDRAWQMRATTSRVGGASGTAFHHIASVMLGTDRPEE
jgi:hypothetical protein